jgi:hypothetical protein
MAVKIPKEIARRIEELRAIAWTNLQIMTEALRPESEFVDYVKLNFDAFSKALTDGYEIKDSPEEEIRRYFKSANADSLDYFHSEDEEEKRLSEVATAKVDAMLFTLAELGVQIPGVNIDQ